MGLLFYWWKNKASFKCNYSVSSRSRKTHDARSSDIYDRMLMVAKAYNKKKKGGKNNSKVNCHYCKDIGHIQYTCPKAKEDIKELKMPKSRESLLKRKMNVMTFFLYTIGEG